VPHLLANHPDNPCDEFSPMPSPAPSATPATGAEFLATIRTADLLSPTQLARAEAAVRSAPTSTHAAHALVAAGLLTKFQAGRLLTGRPDGFHLGPYVIQEKIGRGALGKVFRAKHRTMNRSVAVKVLSADVTRAAGTREAIQWEVRAAAQLCHPNVVTAYDADELGERFYLVVEFVDGPNLEALVRERGPLPVAETCELIRQAALGLAHAHGRGMIHRNLKPANLLVAPPSDATTGAVLKIADFGIAKLSRSENLDCTAPEQAHDPQLADHRADLYSLGAVFYFLLAGRPPFPAGTRDETVRRHVLEEPVRIERPRPDAPAPVAALVHQLLAKTPDARPASAMEVAERLGAFVGVRADAAGFPPPVALPVPPAGALPETDGLSVSERHPVAASETETAQWEEITVATAGLPDPTTLTWELPRPAARKPRASNLSAWLTGGLAAGMFLACAAAIGVIVRVVGK
jgi:serine/threonine protein kinase